MQVVFLGRDFPLYSSKIPAKPHHEQRGPPLEFPGHWTYPRMFAQPRLPSSGLGESGRCFLCRISQKTRPCEKSGGTARGGTDQRRDIVVQSLVNHGVDTIFAYPGGARMELHQALARSETDPRDPAPPRAGRRVRRPGLRARHRPGRRLHGHQRPRATNLVTAIADAKLESIPLLAITGQVPTAVIGTDAFQETPIVEVCRSVTSTTTW